jgi:hypothetical protein
MPHSSGVPELPPRFCACLQPVAMLVSRNTVLGKPAPGHNPGQQIQYQKSMLQLNHRHLTVSRRRAFCVECSPRICLTAPPQQQQALSSVCRVLTVYA